MGRPRLNKVKTKGTLFNPLRGGVNTRVGGLISSGQIDFHSQKRWALLYLVTGKAAWQGVRIGPSEWYFSSGLAKAILLMAELLMNSPFDLEENR